MLPLITMRYIGRICVADFVLLVYHRFTAESMDGQSNFEFLHHSELSIVNVTRYSRKAPCTTSTSANIFRRKTDSSVLEGGQDSSTLWIVGSI